MKLKYIPPIKLKVLIVMFFVGAGIGIGLGLLHHHMYLTLLGVVNLILGGFMGYLLLTQTPKVRDRRKK
jgi:Kef-type K+ transport system membrane component KefB|tara:strand:+ start:141 stop:347 length:207 start_codon:yes stop_codon:yes gene_type:complete